VVTSAPIKRPELVLPPVDELNMRDVEWVIITRENMDAQLSKLTAGGAPLAMFVLTGDGYEALALNFSDIRALVQQQQAIIFAYERYYKEAEEAMDNVTNTN